MTFATSFAASRKISFVARAWLRKASKAMTLDLHRVSQPRLSDVGSFGSVLEYKSQDPVSETFMAAAERFTKRGNLEVEKQQSVKGHVLQRFIVFLEPFNVG